MNTKYLSNGTQYPETKVNQAKIDVTEQRNRICTESINHLPSSHNEETRVMSLNERRVANHWTNEESWITKRTNHSTNESNERIDRTNQTNEESLLARSRESESMNESNERIDRTNQTNEESLLARSRKSPDVPRPNWIRTHPDPPLENQ